MNAAELTYLFDVLGIRDIMLDPDPIFWDLIFITSVETPEVRELLTKLAAAVKAKTFCIRSQLPAKAPVGQKILAFGCLSPHEAFHFEVILAPAIQELLGSDPEVNMKKKILWEKIRKWSF